MNWEKVKLGEILSESRIPSDNPNVERRITVRLNVLGVEKRRIETEIHGATKQYIRSAGQFIYGKQNFHKGAFGIIPKELSGFETSSDLPSFDIDERCLPEWLFYFFKQGNYYLELSKIARGVATQRIHPEQVYRIEIPLPKIEVQTQILQSIHIIEKNTDFIQKEQSHQLNLVQKLRQQILKDAMQGKLVAQNEDDEPASELLKKIKVEKGRLVKEKKMKKEKPLLTISKDEIPFEIPGNWEWCRLGDVVNMSRGRFSIRPRNDPRYFGGKYPFIQIGSLDEKGSLVCTAPQSLNEKGLKVSKEFPKETIMVAIVGGTIGNIGVLAVNMCFPDSIVGIIPLINLNQTHILNFLRYMQPNIREAAYQMAGQPNIKISTLAELVFPVPPLAEQQRIVSKIDELMQLCDGLEKSITQNQEYTNLLYQTALKEALQPKPLRIKTEAKPNEKCKIIPFTPRYCGIPERAILAGYIINQCNSNDFGRVQFQKLLYLVEHVCIFDFNSNYVKKPAGPHDDGLIKEVEGKLQQYQYYKIDQEKTGNKRVHYKALGSATELDSLFTTNFVDEKDSIDQFIAKFKKSKSDQCEIIATLYAVWNNRIIETKLINPELLKADFLEWDEGKARYKDRLDDALDWMKEKNIIPNGYGKIIERPMSM